MFFDCLEIEFMKLCGLCRYIPDDVNRRFKAPVFSRSVTANLQILGLIKQQSDGSSCKLTRAGEDVLADIGYVFPSDIRTLIKTKGYRRKLISAKWSVLLYLAGINVFLKSSRELADSETGYVSSLILRADSNIKVLAGTRFHGLLRMRDTVYIPYHIEGTSDWIIPGHEKEVFAGQVASLRGIKRLRLILFANTLEELWAYIHPENESDPLTYGRYCFDIALKEMGCEALMVPLDGNGVMQVKVLAVRGYRKRIARALGCLDSVPEKYSRCDGMLEDRPCIVAIDLNAERIQSALYQICLGDPTIMPKVVCFSFQKPTLLNILRYYGCQKCTVVTLRESDLYRIFPECNIPPMKRQPFVKKDGELISVKERNYLLRRKNTEEE